MGTCAPNIEIHFELSSKCIFKCIHCSSENKLNNQISKRAFPAFVRFLHEMENRSNVRVFLTGGEPIIYPGLLEVITEIEKEPSVAGIGVFTIGCLMPKFGRLKPISPAMAKELRSRGLSCCYLSLYSYGRKLDIHEKVTGMPGSFACAVKSLRNLASVGIETKVHCPVMKLNRRHLAKIALDCEENGVKEIRFLRLVRHGRAAENWGCIGLNRTEQKAAIVESLEELEKLSCQIAVTVAGFPEICDCRPFNLGKMCQAGIRLFYVDWKGDIFPCACKKRDQNFILGNIFGEQPFCGVHSAFRGYNTKCLQDV